MKKQTNKQTNKTGRGLYKLNQQLSTWVRIFSELPVDAKTYHVVVLLRKTHLVLTECMNFI